MKRLSVLAAIYLPLALVTGIFSMNIWEINEGSPRRWAVLAAAAVVAVPTVGTVIYLFDPFEKLSIGLQHLKKKLRPPDAVGEDGQGAEMRTGIGVFA